MIFNLLPEVLWIGHLISPLVLRVALGLLLLIHTYQIIRIARGAEKRTAPYIVAALYGVIGICLFLGLFTQYVALLGVALTSFMLFFSKRFTGLYRASPLFYGLAEAVFFTMVLTGAGPLSLDSPL